MRRYPEIPELVEEFMRLDPQGERWVTVHELRDHFGLSRYQSNTASAFLRRLRAGPYGRFPFIVARIERSEGKNPSDPKKCRYLLRPRRHLQMHRLPAEGPGGGHRDA